MFFWVNFRSSTAVYALSNQRRAYKFYNLAKEAADKAGVCIVFFTIAHFATRQNGSGRAIRNIKVKQKISGQFESLESANVFAILRSAIDTAIKSGYSVLNALQLITTFGTE